jgi:hypothetical protein
MRIELLLLASTLAAQPQLDSGCVSCHRQTKTAGYFVETYGGLMDGVFRNGRFEPNIVPGSAVTSRLISSLATHRRPLAVEAIQKFRGWIDAGAKPDPAASPEHRIDVDGVPLDAARDSFWLSCRAPRNGQNISLRVKVVDEASGRVVAYDWPTASRDLNGRWSQWKIQIPKNSMTLPGKVSVQLYVAARGGNDAGLDGVIFLIEPKQTPDAELLKQKDLRTIAHPQSPPHETMRFTYVLRAPSDVTLTVRPEGGKDPLFRWTDRDLPAGRVLETPWKLQSSPGLEAGWYSARLMCTSRNPAVFQPDMAILFRILR